MRVHFYTIKTKAVITGRGAVRELSRGEEYCLRQKGSIKDVMAQRSLEEANSPAAIRAALAKFPVSMQAINSLLSSTVFLRTRAGFPFPHFGRLRVVLKGEREVSPDLLLIGWIQPLPESSNLDHPFHTESQQQPESA